LAVSPPAPPTTFQSTFSATGPAAIVKKEAPVAAAASKPAANGPVTKDAKADLSFFSAPKPKTKLPSFKKITAVKKEQDSSVAQPSNVDPFQQALQAMGKSVNPDPSTSKNTPSTSFTAPTTLTASTSNVVKPFKKKKSVTFPEDGSLVQIREFTPNLDEHADEASFYVFCHVSGILTPSLRHKIGAP
jgi:protein phosphatase 1 regulatory subunit 10